MPKNKEIDLKRLQDISYRDCEIKKIYQDCKPLIFGLGKQFGMSKPDCEDILQDAIVVLWKQLNNNDFQLSCKVSTFIYAVAKRMFINRTRNSKTGVVDLSVLENHIEDINIDETLFETRYTQVIMQLEKIGEKCKSLITDFYLGLSMPELAKKHGYTTVHNATVQRYKCMKRLKDRLETQNLSIL